LSPRPRPRPRPKFWPGGHFGLEDLTSLVIIKSQYKVEQARKYNSETGEEIIDLNTLTVHCKVNVNVTTDLWYSNVIL